MQSKVESDPSRTPPRGTRLPGRSGMAPRGPRRTRSLLAGTTLVSGLAAVLLLAAPFALAHGTVTFTAPYTGFTQSPYNYTYASGCAAYHQPTTPTWTSSTGTFQISASVNAAKCASFNYAEAYASLELISPAFTTPYASFGYVYADLSAAFSAKASVHLGTATNGSYVFGDSEVEFVAGLYVYDVTHHNGSLFGYGTTTLVDQSFFSTGSYSLTTSWTNSTLYAFGTFAAHHLYQVEFDITALVFAESENGSTAAAALNLAGTNGLTVSSIEAT